MKKLITVISSLLFLALSIYTPVYAASVDPIFYPGNDSNPMFYTPPEDCIHYEIPNSGAPGTYTATFDETGAVDPDGDYSFTVVVGTEPGEEFTKVLSWSSNFPIYAVIVKGGDAFNLYPYESTVRGDTDLVSPDTESGRPADVSHVSIVICPEDFPPDPPDPTCPPVPTCPPEPTCPPKPICPPRPVCLPFTINICIVIFIGFVVVFFLLGLLFGLILDPPTKKHRHKKDDGKRDDKDKPNEHNGPHHDKGDYGQQEPRKDPNLRPPRNNFNNYY